MNRYFTKYVVFCLLLLLISCGRRTIPQPYDAAKSSLQPLPAVSVKYQGRNLVFSWMIPPNRIGRYRLHWLKTNPDCAACQALLVTLLDLDPAFSETDEEESSPGATENLAKYYTINGRLSWQFAPDFFKQNKVHQGDGFIIDYTDTNDKVSQPSRILFPIRPQPIPIPEVSITKLLDSDLGNNIPLGNYYFGHQYQWLRTEDTDPEPQIHHDVPINSFLPLDPFQIKSDGNLIIISNSATKNETGSECTPTRGELLLILNWSLQQESIIHKVQKDGTISESAVYYGLNLYRVKKDMIDSPLQAVNSEPLRDGSFSLVNFSDLLYARYQDRHGNESEAVLVFDGAY